MAALRLTIAKWELDGWFIHANVTAGAPQSSLYLRKQNLFSLVQQPSSLIASVHSPICIENCCDNQVKNVKGKVTVEIFHMHTLGWCCNAGYLEEP